MSLLSGNDNSDNSNSNSLSGLLSNSNGGSSTITTVLALIAGSASFVVAFISGVAAYFRDKNQQQLIDEQNRRFETFKTELQDKQRRMVRYENIQELMKQYKKPLLQSAFDLQSRLSNQIKQNFLHVFVNKRNGSTRDANYAKYNFAYVIGEFLGWLEVIRQEIVFITGDGQAMLLSSMVDAIKFQFTGEAPQQGIAPKGKEDDPDYDKHATILQLYAGELRAIGEVMLYEKTVQDAAGGIVTGTLSVIGYAEFVRKMRKTPVSSENHELHEAWEHSAEKHMQETLKPLMEHVERLSALGNTETPKKRIAILQVLLCKLIDMLDDAVPWDCGPKYDLANGEEPLYIPRDFRVTPLIKYINKDARKWAASLPMFADTETLPSEEWQEWWKVQDIVTDVDDIRCYKKLNFIGFRDDLHKLSTAERLVKGGPDIWPGAFPPKLPRKRQMEWYNRLSDEDKAKYYTEFYKMCENRWIQQTQMLLKAEAKGSGESKEDAGIRFRSHIRTMSHVPMTSANSAVSTPAVHMARCETTRSEPSTAVVHLFRQNTPTGGKDRTPSSLKPVAPGTPSEETPIGAFVKSPLAPAEVVEERPRSAKQERPPSGTERRLGSARSEKGVSSASSVRPTMVGVIPDHPHAIADERPLTAGSGSSSSADRNLIVFSDPPEPTDLPETGIEGRPRSGGRRPESRTSARLPSQDFLRPKDP